MFFSLAHHAAHGHHLGAVAAALVAVAVVTGGYFADRPAGEPRVEVTVVEVTDPATPVAAPTGTLATGTPAAAEPAPATASAPSQISVTVPTADEIRAQCEAAGLLAECRAAGLR